MTSSHFPSVGTLLTRLFVASMLLLAGVGIGRRVGSVRAEAPAQRNSAERHFFADQAHLVANWRDLSATGQLFGDPEAKVRIVEFVDFACDSCLAAESLVDGLLRQHSGRLAVDYLYLTPTEKSRQAALAVECAAAQFRLAEFRSELLRAREQAAAISWTAVARRAGVPDLGTFARCVAEGWFSSHLLRDSIIAARLQVGAAPTFVVHGFVIPARRAATQLPARVTQALFLP